MCCSTVRSSSSRMVRLATTASTTTSSSLYKQPPMSVYARVWRFVQTQLHLRPTPIAPVSSGHASQTEELPCSWGMIPVLKELEAATWSVSSSCRPAQLPRTAADHHNSHHNHGAARTKCQNCAQLFFRALAESDRFCGLDCKSSFEYMQHVDVLAQAQLSDWSLAT